jgi:hypothetical protein
MNLICKLFGHKWGPVYSGNTAIHQVPHRYDCVRCGAFGSNVFIVRRGSVEDAYEREDPPSGDPMTWIEHLRGIPWWEAGIPPRNHQCWAQTRGFIRLNLTQRCACGAIRMPRHHLDSVGWSNRNSRTDS